MRTKYSYKDSKGDIKRVETNLKIGDRVKINLSNSIVEIDEIFAADHYHNMWTEGLNIRGTVIHDGTCFNTDKGEKTYSIPIKNIIL